MAATVLQSSTRMRASTRQKLWIMSGVSDELFIIHVTSSPFEKNLGPPRTMSDFGCSAASTQLIACSSALTIGELITF